MKRVMISGLIVIALVFGFAGAAVADQPEDNPGNGPPQLEKIVFIHYEKGAKVDSPAKPERPGKPGGGNPVDYYQLNKLILPGQTTYRVNASGSGVLTDNDGNGTNDAIDAVNASFNAWDMVTAGSLFVYGGETFSSGTAADGQNTVSWAAISDSRVIAQTTMWYYPGKPPRSIVEYDVVFNSLKTWGIDPDGEEGPIVLSGYDVQNIGTHEVGHPVGLSDLYEGQYGMLTMYGYSSTGETNKRSLESGDIKGAQSIYGAG